MVATRVVAISGLGSISQGSQHPGAVVIPEPLESGTTHQGLAEVPEHVLIHAIPLGQVIGLAIGLKSGSVGKAVKLPSVVVLKHIRQFFGQLVGVHRAQNRSIANGIAARVVAANFIAAGRRERQRLGGVGVLERDTAQESSIAVGSRVARI